MADVVSSCYWLCSIIYATHYVTVDTYVTVFVAVATLDVISGHACARRRARVATAVPRTVNEKARAQRW